MKKRRSIRLRDYDYTQEGLYFITICVRKHRCVFWKNDRDRGENMVSPVQKNSKGNVVGTNPCIRPNDVVGAIPCNRPNKEMIRPNNNQFAYLNDAGLMVDKWWRKMFEKYCDGISMDTYVIMPNHVHGIIIIKSKKNHVGAIPRVSHVPVSTRSRECNRPNKIPNAHVGIGRYISWFKRMSTNEYIRNVKNNNWSSFNKKLWQRNYYEHIIRNEYDWYFVSEYIDNNPLEWKEDKYFSNEIE